MKVSMFRKACAILAITMAMPVLSQVEPSADGVDFTEPDQGTRMITPPVVSDANLPLDSEFGRRSNYLSGGVTFNSAYVSNVQPGVTSASLNDESYSIWPTLTFLQTTPLTTRILTYRSGFTFYQRTKVLDSINQNMDARIDYKLSPRISMSLRDSLRQNSNVFNQPLVAVGGAIPPTDSVPSPGVVIPFEEEFKNDVNAIFSYQFAQFAMIGAKVGFQSLNFPNLTKGSGLNNSIAESASGFYSRRVSRAQYFGAIYQGANVVASQLRTTARTQSFSFFYTRQSSRNFTLSLSGGPQYLNFMKPDSRSYQKWTPSVRAGVGWQTSRTRLTADYSRAITAGQGIPGAYASNSADASLRFQLAPNWIINSLAVYQNDKNSLPASLQPYPGGHTLSGTASVGYNIGEHLMTGLGYTRLHQRYSGITEISRSPDSDRVFVSISYYFRAPLGR